MYINRQVQVRTFFEANKQLKQNLDFITKTILIDSSNNKIEKVNFIQNYKYRTYIDQEEINQQIVIINPYIAQQLDFSLYNDYQIQEISNFTLPIEDRNFLDQYKTNEEKVQLIYRTIMNQFKEEKDILIYCSSINEIEQFRILFDQLRIRVIIKIDAYFDTIYEELISNPKEYDHTIFLVIHPQQLESDDITLIVHTHILEVPTLNSDNTINFIDEKLSKADLQIREISKSNKRAIMIYYAFSEQEYINLPITITKSQPQYILMNQYYKNILLKIKQEHSSQLLKFSSLIACITTSGSLLAISEDKNRDLKIRSSQVWNKNGDLTSNFNILQHYLMVVEEGIKDKVDQKIKKFCFDSQINLVKLLIIVSRIKQLSEELQIDIFNFEPLTLCKQSSSQYNEQDYTELDQDLMKQYFSQFDKKQFHSTSLMSIFKFSKSFFCFSTKNGTILHGQYALKSQRKVSMKEYIIHNISNLIMTQIWNGGEQSVVSKIENKFLCSLQPLDSNSIVLFSDSNLVIQELTLIIKDFQEKFLTEEKYFEYLSSKIKFQFQSGGTTAKYFYSDEAILKLSQLSLETTEEDIKNLILPYSPIITIELYQEKNCKTALIDIESKGDIQEIISDMDETEFKGQIIRASTTKSSNTTIHKKKYQSFLVKLTWFIYHCKGNAETIWKNVESAQQFYDQFNGNLILEGKKIKLELRENKIFLSNLSQYTTERDLLGLSSQIVSVIISKIVLHEPKFDIFSKVENILKEEANSLPLNQRGQHCQKLKNKRHDYKRSLTIGVASPSIVELALSSLHNSLFQLGLQQIRLYCEGKYRHQFSIKSVLVKFVQNNIIQLRNKLGQLFKFKEIESNQDNIVFLLESNNNIIFVKVRDSVQKIIDGELLNFGEMNKILLTTQGQQFLQDLEISHNTIFHIDQFKQTIKLCCLEEEQQTILDKIKSYLDSNCTITVKLTPQKLKKLIGQDGQGLNYLLNKFNLTSAIPTQKRSQLELNGQAQNVESALLYLQSFLISEEENINNVAQESNTCSYCLSSMKLPYILNNCEHKFCLECINFDFNNTIKDISQLPIKCPLCQISVCLQDIEQVVGAQQFNKMIEMSINKFVTENREVIVFCFNPGCPNLLKKTGLQVYCDVCKTTFCTKCKIQWHTGLTCWEYQTGDQKIMAELMKKDDIRFCPECRSLMQKISGCMSVACTCCRKSICWKIGPSGNPCMKVFPSSRECHEHLNQVHGGYY